MSEHSCNIIWATCNATQNDILDKLEMIVNVPEVAPTCPQHSRPIWVSWSALGPIGYVSV